MQKISFTQKLLLFIVTLIIITAGAGIIVPFPQNFPMQNKQMDAKIKKEKASPLKKNAQSTNQTTSRIIPSIKVDPAKVDYDALIRQLNLSPGDVITIMNDGTVMIANDTSFKPAPDNTPQKIDADNFYHSSKNTNFDNAPTISRVYQKTRVPAGMD